MLTPVAASPPDAVAVTYWPGGSSPLEGLALQRAEAVVVYGGDEVVTSLRARTPVTTRFVSYHHRLSAGLVGREALTEERAPHVARMAARAVSMFDQRGCVSPHVIYVEEGGAVDPAEWAALLASAMADLEVEIPGGLLTAPEASAVHQMRGSAELREASKRFRWSLATPHGYSASSGRVAQRVPGNVASTTCSTSVCTRTR